MSAKDKKTTIKDLKKAAEDAQQTWLDAHPPEEIECRVHELMNRNLQKIVIGLLGFEHRWDRWEVDHCNGRGGNSAAGDYLRSCASAAVDKWFRSVDLEKVKIPNSLVKSMKQEFESKVKRDLQRMVTDAASGRATDLFEEFMGRLTSEWRGATEGEEEE